MAAKFSTGLRQYMANEGSMRECFGDSKIRIFSGQAPNSPDDAEDGDLLCEISVDGEVVSAGEISTSRIYELIIAHSGAPDVGDKVKLLVNSVAYEYTVTANESTVALLAIKVAQMLNGIDGIIAIPQISTGQILVTTWISGIDLTITDNTSTGGLSTTPTSKQSPARSDALYFDAGVLGVMDKPTGDTWVGENVKGGTAGYFRLVKSDDSEGQSYTEPRVQGVCSTSGAEMNLSSLLFVIGADTKLKTFRITFPES